MERPIVFIDLEATGPDVQRDRIIEIAMIKRFPDGQTEQYLARVNPNMRIPRETIAIHHITNEDVASCPSFRQLAPEVTAFLADSDIGGFGVIRFDIPMLIEEYHRIGQDFSVDNRHVFDALNIFHQKERRDLAAAYNLYCGKELTNAHSALADAEASMEVLFSQLERYPDLPQDRQGLHDFCNKVDDRFIDSTRKFAWRDGEAAFNFGKYKGELLRIMAQERPDYLEWMVTDGKFSQDVIDICWKALKGEFPQQIDEKTILVIHEHTTVLG